jgi:hypothetical protein
MKRGHSTGCFIHSAGASVEPGTDAFGVNIQYTPVSPQSNTLPNSAPQLLKGGDIKVK